MTPEPLPASRSGSKPPFLSVVAPAHNEEQALPAFHERLLKTLRDLKLPFEIVYVDDGSRDGTPEVLSRFRREDPAVKVLTFSRNFGHQMAITAGMDHAAGDAVVIMDTDGQDPPETIPQLVEAWRGGAEVVYAVRSRREGEGWFKLLTAALFYRLMRRMTHVEIPLDAGDFRLLDQKVVRVLRDLRETHRFMRGLTSWVGFRQTRVEYERKARLAGETHYPFLKMLRFAIDGITSFSHQPLRWVTFCGIASFLWSVAIGCWVIYVKIYYSTAVRGWTSLMAIVLFLGGLQMISIGVMGEYLARIFDEVKVRPLYVIREAAGFEPKGADPRRS